MFYQEIDGDFAILVSKRNRPQPDPRGSNVPIGVRSVRLARRLDSEKRPSVRARLNEEFERIFRALSRDRARG
jgi:hypothetical protein